MNLCIGEGLLDKQLPEFCKQLDGRKILIADEALKELYAIPLAEKIGAQLLTIPNGEKAKTLSTAQSLLHALFELGADRKTTLIALGGGSTTDLVGFVASIYMRGVPLILVPTTLLAIVDASIGGKTAVDTAFGKNLIGTYYEPKAIFADLDTLKTLPEKERLNGKAEITKMQLIYGTSADIEQTIKAKIEIVAQDPRDQGIRRILNFGHTIGHALEAASDYEIPHGEAVALGCLAESHLSMRLGYLSKGDFEKIQTLYGPLKLPQGYTRTKFLQALTHDKKKADGQIRFVLIDRIGHALPFDGAYCRPVSLSELEPTLDWMENRPVRIPGSKSYTNRALIMAALTKGAVRLKNPLYSDDTEAMIGCLRTIGIEIETNHDEIIVHGDIGSVENNTYHLFAHDSGTTLRFILALSCIVPGVKILQGNPRLMERPIQDLVDALSQLGAEIDMSATAITVKSSTLSGNVVALKSDISSQYCSALLLIAPLLPNGLKIKLTTAPISKPYIDMTVSCMRQWGIKIQDPYFVPPQNYQKTEYLIEGDYSSAAYFFAIAALTKKTITLENLSPFSAQPDRKFLTILEKMGNRVTYGENQITIQGERLHCLDINMEDCPDQVMTLAVLAAFAKGKTTISGIRSLRVKETDRVLALKNELSKMGIKTEESEDSITIHGGNPKPAVISSYNDHRIAMSFAVAKIHLSQIEINEPEVVKKTFPNFWETVRSLA
ncbi:MAG: 3-phosphoshikimate 1-carboxyvinyltransferase [Verrucomicrobia bacterium]|nr:3-phosphoshikimate 1-carboxyvinyltransferase [Verrucomicrobiota bacterium]